MTRLGQMLYDDGLKAGKSEGRKEGRKEGSRQDGSLGKSVTGCKSGSGITTCM